MKHKILHLIIFLFSFFIIINNSYAQPPQTSPTSWELIFEDEFNGSSLDLASWQHGYTIPSIDEFACITFGDNIVINNGTLKIISKKESYDCHIPIWDANLVDIGYNTPYQYTVGQIKSNNKYKYGYFEIVCKLPSIENGKCGYPNGPNFWLYEQEPNCQNDWSEIDIFEYKYDYINSLTPVFSPNVHYQKTGFAKIVDLSDEGDGSPLPSFNYHTYGVEWTDKVIKIYLDGLLHHTAVGIAPKSLMEMRIWIDTNLPVGDDIIQSNTQFPYIYEVDKVRVYKKKETFPINNGNQHFIQPPESTPNLFNFQSPYTMEGAFSYQIAGNNSFLSVLNNSTYEITAQNNIAISENFSVEFGGNFLAHIKDFNNECNYTINGIPNGKISHEINAAEPSSTIELQNPIVNSINLTIFPNPNTTRILEIMLPENSHSNLNNSIIIEDFVGREVFRKNNINSKNFTIELTDIKSGLYQFIFTNGIDFQSVPLAIY